MGTESGNLEEYRWLVSCEAGPWLEKASEAEDSPESLLTTTVTLRRDLGVSRTHLVIAQTQLRRRAGTKFRDANRMFFTRQLLEQATDSQIAAHKAARFPEGAPVADLCCGIGGDLVPLARRGPTHGVDRDDLAALLADANCRALGLESATVQVDDAGDFGLSGYTAWHLDPDRRPEGKRTTRLELHDPDLEAMERLLSTSRQAAIKLAPAATVPAHWSESAELEWIGNRGECRQQVAWFGDLAQHPGQRVATVFANGVSPAHTVRGEADVDVPTAESVGRYVFEPHAAVLAADLTGVVAAEHGLKAISPRIAYLTGDQPIDSPELSCFEVVEAMPFSSRRVRTELRRRGIGRLEVKKRGTRLSPEQVLEELSPSGDEAATLMLMALGKKVLAILCHRV
jgi:hypothetical protein